MRAIQRLGEDLERAWLKHGGADEAFAPLAMSALTGSALFSEGFYGDLRRWFLRAPSLPEQHFRDFGQPALTLYRGHKFLIELLVWLDGTTAIHQHSFAGAFGVLRGSSLHSRYSFSWLDRPSSEIVFGKLRLERAELLRAGDVRMIAPGAEMIHALFHLDHPTLSLVIRTDTIARFKPQYSYRRPGLGFDPLAAPEPFSTRLRFLDSLREAGDRAFWPMMRRAMDESDPWMALALLQVAYRARVGRLRERFFDCARDRHGGRAETMLASLDERARERCIVALRRHVLDADHRFLLALLLNLPDRDSICRMIGERHPSQNAADLAVGWLSDLSRDGGLGIELDALSLKMVRFAMHGLRLDDLEAALVQAFGPTQVATQASRLAARWESLRSASILRPLFVDESPMRQAA